MQSTNFSADYDCLPEIQAWLYVVQRGSANEVQQPTNSKVYHPVPRNAPSHSVEVFGAEDSPDEEMSPQRSTSRHNGKHARSKENGHDAGMLLPCPPQPRKIRLFSLEVNCVAFNAEITMA